ncbi:antibiotic biosynthesis monooxygenase [Alteraurantiacibacter aestuarii]|uniref:Antibiotic biosynthesis monooxygenase n=1 Tax=Alteraurantiacibacter aestuarii TaxID=650004 RepID=A0A844ZN71_9SPHN|nr:antibiotic biosynthesis monooxygenase [Alteraurantiacibacter aestuarii]MXO88297.1 antibiotic biosynthesis monooxygenase [Alteraurantiacibacter aestuarii]
MFLVVFRSRKRDGIDYAAYEALAARMVELARDQPGYISFKSYTADDGEVVAISEWADEASARGWGLVEEHRAAQQDGRARWYAGYTLFACANPRIHEFSTEDKE